MLARACLKTPPRFSRNNKKVAKMAAGRPRRVIPSSVYGIGHPAGTDLLCPASLPPAGRPFVSAAPPSDSRWPGSSPFSRGADSTVFWEEPVDARLTVDAAVLSAACWPGDRRRGRNTRQSSPRSDGSYSTSSAAKCVAQPGQHSFT